MKKLGDFDSIFSLEMKEMINFVKTQRKRNIFPISLFFLLCCNLIFAPMIYAATGEEITRKTAWAIGVLILVTLAIAVYLLAVIFKPEWF